MTENAVFELLSLVCRVDAYGAVRYYNALGQCHRVYGPAIEYPNGRREWWQNGQRHRTDGPAVEYEYADGYRAWCQNGLLHRLDGPAVEYPNGRRDWFINGNELTEAEWQQAVASMESV
jgi:hypothetical protein